MATSKKINMKNVEKWTVQEVLTWVRSMKLVKYVVAFQKNNVNGKKLCEIYDNDNFLQNVLGVKVRLHRVRILRAFEQLNQESTASTSNTTVNESKNKTPTRKNKAINKLAKHERVASAPSKMSRAQHKLDVKNHQQKRQPHARQYIQNEEKEMKNDGNSNIIHDKNTNSSNPTHLYQQQVHLTVRTKNLSNQKNAIDQHASPVAALNGRRLSNRRVGRVVQNHNRRTPTGNRSPSAWSQSSIESNRSSFDSIRSSTGEVNLAANNSSNNNVNKKKQSPLSNHVSDSPDEDTKDVKQMKNNENSSIIGGNTTDVNLSISSQASSTASSTASWRPYSAPIGFARKKLRHRRLSSGNIDAAKTFCWTWDQLLKEMESPLNEWLRQVVSSLGIADNDADWNIMLSNVISMLKNEGYLKVRDLIEDLHDDDFRADLRSYGMKKRFLNEVCHRLHDIDCSSERLVESAGNGNVDDGVGNHHGDDTYNSFDSSSELGSTLDKIPSDLILPNDSILNSTVNTTIDNNVNTESPMKVNNRYSSATSNHVEDSSDSNSNRHTRRQAPSTNNKKAVPRIQPSPSPKHKVKKKSKGLVNPFANLKIRVQKSSSSSSSNKDDGSRNGSKIKAGAEKKKRTGLVAPAIEKLELDVTAVEKSFDMQQSWVFTSQGTLKYDGFEIRQDGVKTKPVDALTVSTREKLTNDKDEPASNNALQREMVMLNKLGSGAGGIVKKGLHIPSMVVTAVKRIKVFQHSQLKQMARELRTLYSCSAATEISGKGKCPHVVSFFGAYTNRADSTISIVLEYMDAGSLQDLINANVCMDEGVIANIGYRVLKGLDFLHKRNILHRDIKPSNLLINRDGDVKISDFGIARQLEATDAMSQTYLGTLMYMAPERIHTSSYGKPADIWAVGLSLLACRLGRFPFQTKGGYWALTHAITVEPLEKLLKGCENDLSPELKDFIHCCLAKDANKRPSASELLKHEFFKAHNCAEQLGTLIQEDQGEMSLTSSMSEMQQSMDDDELDTIAEQVVKHYMKMNFSRSPDAEDAREEFNYEEWGNVDAVKQLYIKPNKLKRLAKQMGLPTYYVIRKFDKKARELMGFASKSPRKKSPGKK